MIDSTISNKMAMAQLFSQKLTDYLSHEQMVQVIIDNRNEKNGGVCHSHDYCDANVFMLDVFEENNLSIEDENNFALWGEVWDLAKDNEFFYKA